MGFRCSKISAFLQSMSESNQTLPIGISGWQLLALKEILVRFGCGKNKSLCIQRIDKDYL